MDVHGNSKISSSQLVILRNSFKRRGQRIWFVTISWGNIVIMVADTFNCDHHSTDSTAHATSGQCFQMHFIWICYRLCKWNKQKNISCKRSKIKGFLHKQTDQNFGIKVIPILFIYSVGQTLLPHPAKDSCQALDKSLAAISMTWLAWKGLGGIPAPRIQLQVQVEEHSLEYSMAVISTHWHLQSFFSGSQNLVQS